MKEDVAGATFMAVINNQFKYFNFEILILKLLRQEPLRLNCLLR